MIETYFAGTYWGPRRESAEECALRAQVFFQNMAECDPLFSRWFRPPRSRKHSSTPMAVDLLSLKERFSQGRTHNDAGGIIEDLGFLIFADSGQWPDMPPREFSSLTLKGGSYAEHVPNSCVLNLPSDGEPQERLLQASALEKILRTMIHAWDPDWGVVNSSTHQLLTKSPKPVPYIGWMMYLSHRWAVPPALPSPVRVERIEDKGSLIILTPERFTSRNPEHVALASRVRDEFSQAGLLRRFT